MTYISCERQNIRREGYLSLQIMLILIEEFRNGDRREQVEGLRSPR
ncbi:MAG: hypothetical protein HC899_25535 [Leptolyngbyaceae cyanobacterium SM1_4_3]|nr:hypothetical protein [Leptolyngbyaceae cyanobacterium SM1_4_3]